MSDPKVEEIRALLSDGWTANSEQVAYLLTKLDEAEKARDAARAEVERRPQRDFVSAVIADRNAAEERERTLIAGVREALAEYESETHGAFWKSRATAMRAILSRLLPSTPTEEGKKP